ncbi:thiamine-phosphate kinase [Nitrosopumilus sp.]|uniref:thiamine-phosphate kinase n=1 Tax=Nitrosopumilus sp. TaxID=2024843 RepID=UPI00247CC191|nr:thiamine-phosphate kinase [Nitrosopumilus sp.]MCV0411298.1 thiamine-phosphate kinase [Nitrosopumilus sp.]
MTKLDESSIIKIFQKGLGNDEFISEDVEIFNLGKIKIISKTDTLVESTDIPPKMKLADAARKSIIACVSDFAAKGIKPEYGIISVNLPKKISRSKILDIVKGFKKASSEYGIKILGGDTNAGKEIVFNVTLFGNSNNIVTRKGSKKGDLIFVTGPFGYTSVGLDLLLGKRKESGKFAAKSIKSMINPKPKLKFGLKNKKYFSSSMDSSDGLSTTLNEMSKQSKKKFLINNIPADNDLENYAKSHKLDLNSLVFHGGEEYEFVFTVSPKYKQIIIKNARSLKTPIIQIGQVTSGKGVFVKAEKDYVILKDLGWKHF